MLEQTKIRLLRSIKIFVLFGFPLLGFLYAYQFTGQDRETIVPFSTFKAPQIEVKDPFDGNKYVKLKWAQPITVVNYWATWCPPCVEEFPAMIELQRQLQGKGVKLIFVSVDDDWALVEKFSKELSVPLVAGSFFWDPEKKAASAWGSSKFPETYVVRGDGWVLEKIIGAQLWTRPAVVEYFVDLAEKFSGIRADELSSLIWPQAWAQQGPGIHEDDKKTIEKLKKNVATASQNLRNAEAALKEEERNLSEQKVLLERAERAQSETESELKKVKKKFDDVEGIKRKTSESMTSEVADRKSLEARIDSLNRDIKALEKKLEQTRDDLVQVKKDLNTRVQAIETLNEASEVTAKESDDVGSRLKEVNKALDKDKDKTRSAKAELSNREDKVAKYKRQVESFRKILQDQEAKLVEFEKILQK